MKLHRLFVCSAAICAIGCQAQEKLAAPSTSKMDKTVSASASASFIPSISVQPATASVTTGASVSFTATINYPEGMRYLRQPVAWSVLEQNGGTIGQNGLYTAPQVPGVYHVKAQREDFPASSAVIEVKVR